MRGESVSRRRRAALLLALAALCAALAASLVSSYARRVSAQVGPKLDVVVARRDIPRDVTLTYANARTFVTTRAVAERYAPAEAFTAPEQVLGYVTLVKIPAGTYLNPGQLGSDRRASPPEIRRGERAVDVGVSGASGLGSALGPGSRVDVLVTTEGRSGGGRSFLALEDVEVLAAAPADDASAAPAAGRHGVDTVVTLRVSLRQAVFITAAQNFAREVRVLARSAGDHAHVGRTGFAAGALSR